ncbi:MAG: family 16 glycoside hydrolase [Ktedonobacteraceae bacterium]
MTNVNNHKVRLIGAVVFLLIMVISGTIFFYVQGKSSKTSSNGNSAVSPTARKATPTPTPTAQSTPQPLFSDDFTDKSKGWYLGSASGYTRVINNNTLTLADSNHTILTESLPTNTSFDDFMVSVTFTILQANQDDSIGLYLRGDSNLDHDYRIDIYGNNTYAISKEFLDATKSPQVQFLVSPTSAAALKPAGQQNTITVMMKGPELVLLVNGTKVKSVTDSDYASGQIALFVHNSETSSEVEASFNSVVVFPVPDQVPPG